MRDCVKAEASWVCSYSCSAFLALKDQGSVTFAVSSFPLELNDSASRPLCRGPLPSRSAVPPASLFRSQVTQSSVVPGCHGFPTKCPGTSGAGFKSRPRPVLTHEGNASAATPPPPRSRAQLQSSQTLPSQSPAPCTSDWHPPIRPCEALGAQLVSACPVSPPSAFWKGALVSPRGNSSFPVSVPVAGLTLPWLQVAMGPGQ